MSKSWEEVKPLLDDPYVSADAKEESEAEGHHARQVESRISENQDAVEGMKAPGSSAGGVENSDELFDKAEPALQVFKDFIPVDQKAPSDSRGVQGPLNFESDIKKRFDEQRGIDFQTFLDEAQRLRDAHTTLSELKSTTDSRLNAVYKDWTGKAANASYDKYSNEIEPSSQDLLDQLENAPRVIEGAVETVYKACKDKADQVLRLYSQTMGGATKDTAMRVVKIANGNVSSQDEILEVAAWVDMKCGSSLEARIQYDDCGLNDENKEYAIRQCKQWIRESFTPDLYGEANSQGAYEAFKQICDDTVEAVDTAWEELTAYLGAYESEFPQAGEQSPTENPSGPGQNVPGGGTGGGSSTPGGGPGSGGPGADSGSGSGQGEQPATNPVTGKPLDTDPETGEPYPIDPQTGEPVKEAGEEPEKLTVGQGENEISMTEPGDGGSMGISVDDGSGEPKKFRQGEDVRARPEDDTSQGNAPEGDSVFRQVDGQDHGRSGVGQLTGEVPAEELRAPEPVEQERPRGLFEPASGNLAASGNVAAGLGDTPNTQASATTDGSTEAGAARPEDGVAAGVAGSAESATPYNGGGPTAQPQGTESPPAEASNRHDGVRSGSAAQQPGTVGIGAAPGGGAAPSPAQAADDGNAARGAAGTGGMGMMGGGAGGDQERGPSQYRIDGGIFESSGADGHISGSLDDDERSVVE